MEFIQQKESKMNIRTEYSIGEELIVDGELWTVADSKFNPESAPKSNSWYYNFKKGKKQKLDTSWYREDYVKAIAKRKEKQYRGQPHIVLIRNGKQTRSAIYITELMDQGMSYGEAERKAVERFAKRKAWWNTGLEVTGNWRAPAVAV